MGCDAAVVAGGGSQSLYSLDFDGTGHVDAGGQNPEAGDFTFACWLNPSTITSYMAIAGTGATWECYLIDANSGYYRLGVTEGSTGAFSASFGTGLWQHFSWKRSGSTNTWYRNGTAIVTFTQGSTSSGAVTLKIGRDAGGGGSHYQGKIDHVASWDGTALSDANIAGLADGSIDPATLSPTGFWKFEAGTGTTAADSGSGAHDGALIGGVTWSSDVPSQLA